MPLEIQEPIKPAFELALSILDEESKAGRIQIHKDLLGNFRLAIHSAEFANAEYLLRSDEARKWIRALLWEKGHLFLYGPTLRVCIDILAGQTLLNSAGLPNESESLRYLETDPLAQLLCRFAESNCCSPRTYSALQLWADLRAFDPTIIRRSRNNAFPGGPNILIRKLRQIQHVLEELGVLIEIRRSNGCKVTLSFVNDSIIQSSSNRPAPNANKDSQLDPLGDKDDVLETIKQAMNHRGNV